jgi:hypothetical protein
MRSCEAVLEIGVNQAANRESRFSFVNQEIVFRELRFVNQEYSTPVFLSKTRYNQPRIIFFALRTTLNAFLSF